MIYRVSIRYVYATESCDKNCSQKFGLIGKKVTERWFGDSFTYQTMNLSELLLILLDIALALAAAYILFPGLSNVAGTAPVAIAALFAAGIMFIIYGD
jgi:hypothetical protein